MEANIRQQIPVGRIIRFAVATAMRQDEIARVEWRDFDASGRMLLIRNRKDPRKKKGNDQRIPLLEDHARRFTDRGRLFSHIAPDKRVPVDHPLRRRVAVAGMSEGTMDQLYLALRVAAIEDYLDHAEPMPFIADDLFINFDDKRSAAGFRVLNELAKKTQVLFFTHHQHLLDVGTGRLALR